TLLIAETLRGDGGKKAVDVRRQHVVLRKEALKNLKEDAGAAEFKANKHIAGDRGGIWMDGRLLQGTFTSTRAFNDVRPDVSCGGIGGLVSMRPWGRGGVAACLADGSVRVLGPRLSLDTWKALAGRDDGQPP